MNPTDKLRAMGMPHGAALTAALLADDREHVAAELADMAAEVIRDEPTFTPAAELAAARAELAAVSDLLPSALMVPVDALTREQMSSLMGMSIGRLLDFRDAGFNTELLTGPQLARWRALVHLVERSRDAGAEAMLDEWEAQCGEVL